jgi:hypothetical protein
LYFKLPITSLLVAHVYVIGRQNTNANMSGFILSE